MKWQEEIEMRKVWLVTGCSSGIGQGIAKAVLKHGDLVVVTARNEEKVKYFEEEYPETALAVSLDVTKNESIEAAVAAALEKFGRIDVLVNNAGYGYRAAVEEGDPEEVNALFATNFFGPIELIKAVLPGMRKQKSGMIMNVSSIAAARSAVGSGYYAASKAALELMTDGLAKECKPLGIEVMTVQPGAFRTRFYDDSLKGTQKKIDDYAETAGKTRKENVVNLHKQPGDPERAGEVLYEMAYSESHPAILSLGSDAVKAVTTTLKARLEELEKWSETSAKSDFQE